MKLPIFQKKITVNCIDFNILKQDMKKIFSEICDHVIVGAITKKHGRYILPVYLNKFILNDINEIGYKLDGSCLVSNCNDTTIYQKIKDYFDEYFLEMGYDFYEEEEDDTQFSHPFSYIIDDMDEDETLDNIGIVIMLDSANLYIED